MSKAAVVESSEEATGIQRIASGPERIVQFLRDTRAEMHKVVTPTRAEVQATTIVVDWTSARVGVTTLCISARVSFRNWTARSGPEAIFSIPVASS